MKKKLPCPLLWSLVVVPLLAGCENKEAPNQLTTIEGKVLRDTDKVPFAGVLVLAEPCSPGFGSVHFAAPVDSARTDASGHYSLHFYNQKGLYYAVSCDPYYTNRKLDFLPFPENGPKETVVGGDIRRRPAVIGAKNEINFYPAQIAVVLLRVQLKNTRFQQLQLGASNQFVKASQLDTVLVRRGNWGWTFSATASLRRVGAGGQVLQDSVITLASLPSINSDTVRATYRFVR